MRFAVVACPGCRRVQGVELRHRRIACASCGQMLEVATLRSFYRGDDEAEARAISLQVTAKQEGMPAEEYARVLATMKAENPGTVDDVLSSLTTTKEFGIDEFQAEMRRRFVPGDAERILEQLTLVNRLYEPRTGRYRFV